MKIALIGPVYPYKGGISHYTGLLYRALIKEHDVRLISYKMQYPKILFKKEQRDYSNDMFKIDETEFLINTANPFNWIGVASKINKMKPDMLIVQWWHPYFAPCYRILSGLISKKTKILFVCHNVFPHERFPMDRFLTRMVLKRGDYFVVHSSLDEEDLKSIKSTANVRKTVLPTFNSFKQQDMSKEKAREILDISSDQKILLFFGFVREYKGLKYLIEAMPEIREKVQNVKLFVVGDFAGDKDEYMKLIGEKGVAEDISIFDGYIPDKEVEKFFAASDLVVLPYVSATQSGIVQIAYNFEKPVVATNVGGLPEVVKDGKTGYVVEPCDPHALAVKIAEFFDLNKGEEFSDGIIAESEKYSWDRMVEIIDGFGG